jgi:hypothetical protein
MNKNTNFAREFRLYESLFTQEEVSLREELDINTCKANIEKYMLGDAEAKSAEELVTEVFASIDGDCFEVSDADMSKYDTVITKDEGNGAYVVKAEDEAKVERLNKLATLCWEAHKLYAGFEYLAHLLVLMGIECQEYWEY